MKKKILYDLRDGLILKKTYNGVVHSLTVQVVDGQTSFKLGENRFTSLTAAAKFVKQSKTEVNGPSFWKAPIKEN